MFGMGGFGGLAPFFLSLKVMLFSGALLFVVGLPLALVLSKPGWPGRSLIKALVSLPLIFPPIALGFFLLLLLGRQGWLNHWLPDTWHIDLIFSFWALVVAAFIAGLPLMVKPVLAALEREGRLFAEAAATLGKNDAEIFWHVTLPSISGALMAGLALGVGRGMGEVGMSLLLGGNLIGKTDTLSLAIYNAVLDGDFASAEKFAFILAVLALALFVVLERLGRGLRR